jgi:hypothetical protein
MTERGLSTPAVERIVRARSTRPPSRWPTGKAKKVPDTEARAQAVLRRLADALKVESVVVVNRVRGEIAAVTGVSQQTQADLDTAVAEANRWLEGQAEVRRDLFARLDEAVAAQRTKQTRELLARVNATSSHDRTDTDTDTDTDTEDVIAAAAADYMTAFTSEAYQRVRGILDDLSRTGRHLQPAQMRPLVEKAIRAAADAGSLTGDREASARASTSRPRPPRPGPPGRHPPETSSSPGGGICTSRWHADTGSREAARAATPAKARTASSTTRPAPARCETSPMTSGSSRPGRTKGQTATADPATVSVARVRRHVSRLRPGP